MSVCCSSLNVTLYSNFPLRHFVNIMYSYFHPQEVPLAFSCFVWPICNTRSEYLIIIASFIKKSFPNINFFVAFQVSHLVPIPARQPNHSPLAHPVVFLVQLLGKGCSFSEFFHRCDSMIAWIFVLNICHHWFVMLREVTSIYCFIITIGIFIFHILFPFLPFNFTYIFFNSKTLTFVCFSFQSAFFFSRAKPGAFGTQAPGISKRINMCILHFFVDFLAGWRFL